MRAERESRRVRASDSTYTRDAEGAPMSCRCQAFSAFRSVPYSVVKATYPWEKGRDRDGHAAARSVQQHEVGKHLPARRRQDGRDREVPQAKGERV